MKRQDVVSAVGCPCVGHLRFVDAFRGRGWGFYWPVSVRGELRTSFSRYYRRNEGLR